MSIDIIDAVEWSPDIYTDVDALNTQYPDDPSPPIGVTPIDQLQGVVDVDFETYREMAGLNYHTLKDFAWDAAAWRAGFFERPESSDALKFGTQFHELILQGEDVFRKNNILWTPPVNDRTGKYYGRDTKTYDEARKQFAEDNPHKREFSPDDAIRLDAMRDSLILHPYASKMLMEDRPKKSEFVLMGELDGINCKCSIDRYDNMFGIIDLKTCDRLTDPSGRDIFRYAISDYKYIEQLAYYRLMVIEVGCGSPCPVSIVVVESKTPYRCAVYAIDKKVIAEATATVRGWLRDYQKSSKTNVFASAFDSICEITKYRKSQ